MRAVLDANVLIAAVLSRSGAPAQLLRAWIAGEFDLVVSPQLLEELERALTYPRLRERVGAGDADAFRRALADAALLRPDPADPPPRSRDRGDDYLLALAEAESAILVSGDRDLLDLAERFPVRSPREFLQALERAR